MNENSIRHDDPQPADSAFLLRVPESAVFSALPETGDAAFDRAIRVVFHHEGFYSDDPDDPGGATAYGVSLRYAQAAGDLDGDGQLDFDINGDGHVDVNDIIALKDAPMTAINLYRLHWWDRYGYQRLPALIALKTFDLAVVMGAPQSHKLLQRAVRAASDLRPVDDGIVGPRTLAAIKSCKEFPLIAAYRSEAAGFFRLLAAQRPQSRKYLGGWLNRAYF